MRAQISIEVLIEFLILLSIVGLMLGTLQIFEKDMRTHVAYQTSLEEAERYARTLDVQTASFPRGGFDPVQRYMVDAHRVLVPQGGQWVVVETLYGEPNEKEAV
ncbi:MAG TPA: hypothetical protein VJH24_01305 [Candidatus Bilamarchaeaceae archaeon]|nr:hypothetical protein [Candidatus Bilamarchaeaceae archaeon]